MRHLSALCRHSGNTAPVSFYGLRRVRRAAVRRREQAGQVVGLAPLEREDYDIVRVEVKQLVDSIDSIVRQWKDTDQKLLTGKKAEMGQIRTLASTYSACRDELDQTEAQLHAVSKANKQLAVALEGQEGEKQKVPGGAGAA